MTHKVSAVHSTHINDVCFVGRVRMLDNNDKVLQLVEYDGKSVSVIVIRGGYF